MRELQNVIERAVILCDDNGILEPQHLGLCLPSPASSSAPVFDDLTPPYVPGQRSDFPTLAEMEKHHIFAALNRCKDNRTHAARLLDVSIRTLRNKLNEYNGFASQFDEGKLAVAI